MAIDLDLEAPANEGGERLPIGKRRFVLNEAYETDQGGKRVQVLHFVVSDGDEFAGRKQKVRLYEEGKGEESTITLKNQIKRYARVLGILEMYKKPGDDKNEYYRYAPGHTEVEFANVIGAECVLDIVHEAGKDDSGKPTGEVFPKPRMFGVMTVEESAAEDAKKAAKGSKGATNGTTPTKSSGASGPGVNSNYQSQPSTPARQLVTDDL